ncbi:transglycosylase domain-containing protein [Sporosarcina sp. HYO08]|uniref:transglycosylase domain-containing protein n=1 Tax=Sporosarcina sp. HYO08 TaxID=1759557 RepID=UPI0007911C7B|nr:transglycosylase domain-containing protein [Sporosarcina sp. HYO08]KXH87166.1 peptidoglycan glycosyltransferase [Sporosarcina sp. HYO08]
MTEHKKNRIDQLEEKYESFQQTKWAKRMRITSGVFWNLFIVMIIFGLTFTVFAASVGAGYFASLVEKEPLRTKKEMRDAIFNYEETSELYFADGVYIGKVNADLERKETKLENVSKYVIDAVLATEDEYFEEHNGIVPKAVFRGIFQDVSNSASQTGGSTLTQQLIKNQVLTNEISYERKAKEILLAMRLEHFMKKNEILEAYLNIIPYGRNANGQNIAGIETAAGGIFNKKASELNLPQAAFIAGIPQAPFAYTPFKSGGGVKEAEYLKPGINRMQTVLFRMKETGYITEAQYNEAIAYDITKDFRDPEKRANERYPYLTQEIQNRTVEILARILAEKDGVDPERLDKEKKLSEKYAILATRSMKNDGYRIFSTVNQKLFDRMNEVANSFNHYGFTYTRERKDPETGEVEYYEDPVQVGAIMIENHTGRILSFVGGRDFELTNVNHATQAYRQNGSSMKPLLVYAPAIEYGVIGAGSPVVDVKFRVGGWAPSNYLASQEMGIIPAREALARSLNLATARLYRDIIDRRPAEFLEKMKFSKLQPGDYENYSASYGGMAVGVSVEENTNAFSTFANDGQFIESYMIEKIEDMSGNIVYEHKVEPVDVFSPQTAYIITDMLRDVLKAPGTGSQVPKYMNFRPDLALKTGTTDFYGDAWIVGYNPNVSLGVWLGYKDKMVNGQKRGLFPRGLQSKTLHPTTRTSMLFGRFMNAANEVTPELVGAGDRFKWPEGVVTRSFCGISGMAPSAGCSTAGLVRSDLFNAKVMVPNKADDSITSSSSVSVKGVRYQPLPSTPAEFITAGGVGVNKAFIDRMLGPWKGNPARLFPANSRFSTHVVSGSVFNADSAPPAAVSVAVNGATMTWGHSASNDVIGYYVYEGGRKIATIRDGSAHSYTIGAGSYTVRAVDITGLLSAPSNVVTIGATEPNQGLEKSEPETQQPGTTTPTKPTPPNNGDSNNGNGENAGNNNNGNGNNNSNGGNGNNDTSPPADEENGKTKQ